MVISWRAICFIFEQEKIDLAIGSPTLHGVLKWDLRVYFYISFWGYSGRMWKILVINHPDMGWSENVVYKCIQWYTASQILANGKHDDVNHGALWVSHSRPSICIQDNVPDFVRN